MLARLKKYVLLVGALAIGLVCAIGLNKEKPEPQADEVVTTQRVYVAAIDMDRSKSLLTGAPRGLQAGQLKSDAAD